VKNHLVFAKTRTGPTVSYPERRTPLRLRFSRKSDSILKYTEVTSVLCCPLTLRQVSFERPFLRVMSYRTRKDTPKHTDEDKHGQQVNASINEHHDILDSQQLEDEMPELIDDSEADLASSSEEEGTMPELIGSSEDVGTASAHHLMRQRDPWAIWRQLNKEAFDRPQCCQPCQPSQPTLNELVSISQHHDILDSQELEDEMPELIEDSEDDPASSSEEEDTMPEPIGSSEDVGTANAHHLVRQRDPWAIWRQLNKKAFDRPQCCQPCRPRQPTLDELVSWIEGKTTNPHHPVAVDLVPDSSDNSGDEGRDDQDGHDLPKQETRRSVTHSEEIFHPIVSFETMHLLANSPKALNNVDTNKAYSKVLLERILLKIDPDQIRSTEQYLDDVLVTWTDHDIPSKI
jgi:hypothetical protein